MRKAMHMQP